MRDYEAWKQLLRKVDLPAVIVDLDAVDTNVDTLSSALGDSHATLRVASKSLRHPWLLRYVLDRGGDRFRGLMTYSSDEAVALAERGFDDFLMGYPVAREADATRLAELTAAGTSVIATVDAAPHVDLLDAAAAAASTVVDVCIDVDMSWRPLGGRVHLGVRRSPIRSVEAALELASLIAARSHLRLRAVLGYEAQVAGMPDKTPTDRLLDPIRRLIKSRSRPVVAGRRGHVVDALRQAGHSIEVVNGGGTGSISFTGGDDSVTEVTAGSGFVCSHLFDHYRGLELVPALFVALPIVRRSDPGYVTAGFGGYIASGPLAADRAPVVYAPPGLSPTGLEGWGEVQTPFSVGRQAPELTLGDPVVTRPAKAGEPAERFSEYWMVRGDRVERREPTYRGLGLRGL